MVLSEALVHLRTMRTELNNELHGYVGSKDKGRIPAPDSNRRYTLNKRIEAIDTVYVTLETTGD